MPLLSVTEKFEIVADVFEQMYGMLPPGKDDPRCVGEQRQKLREELWLSFTKLHLKHVQLAIDSTIYACEQAWARSYE